MTAIQPRPSGSRERILTGVITLGLVAILSACGSGTAPLTAEQVTRQLNEQVPTSTLTTVYTADTDPNKLLGRPAGYLSKTAFADGRLDSGLLGGAPDAMNRGGSVEVFADEDAATVRRDYLQEIGKRAPIFSEYDYQSGPVLLRVSHLLTPQQAAGYEAALPGAASPDNARPSAPRPSIAAPASPTLAAPAPPTPEVPRADPATVSVAAVHDAATVVLTDGTRLRQVGISAPTADTCRVRQATAATDTEVRRAPLTYQLLGQSDLYGNQWAYLQVGSADLGEKLASLGWVWAYPDSPAPQSYNQRIATQVDVARTSKIGLFGSACPESAVPPAPAQSTPPARRIEDGTYVVGVDIEPGSYRTSGPAQDSPIKMCSWFRRKDTSGEAQSVIAMNISQGPTTVTIKPSDGAFESRGCSPWAKVN
jgi:endonuclease YncB( thermonuclease family)